MRICLIGCQGHFGSAVQAAKADPGLCVCAAAPGVAGEDMAKAMSAVERGLSAAPAYYGDWRDMVAREKPDICVVNTEFYMSGPISAELLRMGVHVFAEKPAGISLAQLDELMSAHALGRAQYLSMLTYYYDPAFYGAQCLINTGAIGEARLITAQKSYRLGQRPAFYGDKSKYGGTIPWVGIHAATWAYQMSGGADFISAFAMADGSHNRGNGRLDMTAVMQFRMSRGVLFSATMDFLRPECAPTHGDDRVRVAGTVGVAEVMDGEITVLAPGYEGGLQSVQKAPDANIFADFAGCIKGKPARFTAMDSFAISRAVLCAQMSADTGQIIPVK